MNLLAYVNNLAHYASECDLCTKRDLWKTKFLFEIPFAIAVDCMRILKVTRICGVIVALCVWIRMLCWRFMVGFVAEGLHQYLLNTTDSIGNLPFPTLFDQALR